MSKPVYNDRMSVNFPQGLKQRLQEAAHQQGIDMSSYLRQAVMNRIQADEAKRGGKSAEA